MTPPRLRLILGDQLQHDSPLLRNLEAHDRIVMIEAPGEATHVWSHKARIALFLSAMRHFAQALRERGIPLHYVPLDDPRHVDESGVVGRLRRVAEEIGANALIAVEPGDWRLEQVLRSLSPALRVDLLPDPHFLCTRADFAAWAGGKRALRMEFFYRWMRKRHDILMVNASDPIGGRWNFDASNRTAFPKSGPGQIPPPAHFEPDAITREVFTLVEHHFSAHPGSLGAFGWAATRQQALAALQRFIETRLPRFGAYQDAMWTDTPFGWHALLSTSLNLKLLHPAEVIDAAVRALHEGRAPVESVEGFVRQILGWREFIRGAYWHFMPGLAQANHYRHDRPLPGWYWTGSTRMACMRACIGQTLEHGYAHHIQRLMVTGQFALLAQVDPRQVANWYLAAYVDAVEWVELPNVAGMALHADGGRITSKPYVASGQYIRRMSNYCDGCAYRPAQRSGAQACPVTVLYWNFLLTHEGALRTNPRTMLMAKNVSRLDAAERAAIRTRAVEILDNPDSI